MSDLTKSDRQQIADILNRRSNEIAGYSDDYRKNSNHFGSVELALTREIQRLRRLAEKVNPHQEDEDNGEDS